MSTINEGVAAAEFLLSEARDGYSRETVTLAQSASKYVAGSVLKVASGKYSLAAAADTAVAVLLHNVDATAADRFAVVIDAHASVKKDGLVFGADVDQPAEIAAKIAQLRAVGIKTR